MTRRNQYRENGKRRRGKLLIVSEIIAGFCFIMMLSASLARGYFALLESEIFPLRSIEIEGLRRENSTHILNVLDLNPHVNILSLRLDELKVKVEGLPWVQEARLTLSPCGRLYVHIKERQPIAVIQASRSYLLDRQGFIFKELDGEECCDLPELSGLPDYYVKVGKKLPNKVFLPFKQLYIILNQNKDLLPLKQGYRFRWIDSLGFIIETEDPKISIVFGECSFRERMSRLRAIWKLFEHSHLEKMIGRIDLAYLRRAYVKMIPTGQAKESRVRVNQWQNMKT